MQLKLSVSTIILLLGAVITVNAQWLSNGGTGIYFNGGNVGVGIKAPVGKFQVYGGNAYLWGLNLGHGVSTAVIDTDPAGKELSIKIGGVEYLRVQANGELGIGITDTKGYKLAVNGSAIFTKAVVKAYANWPDYVFHSNYRLPSLSEIEKYIQLHHHLPEVPVAAEVKKDGLNLGDNQALLLKKIEELTLYLIEQNNKLEAQSNKLEQQQQELDVLKQQLQKIR
jgi:hypothetical protein